MKIGLLALLASLGLAICLPLFATAGEVDTDGDTIPDSADNCPTIMNAGQADGDSDAIGDVCDNCSAIASDGVAFPSVPAGVNFCDIDSDGYGGPCDCDMIQPGSLICQIIDFGVLATNFGMPPTSLLATDLDCDGITQISDFGIMSSGFGSPPGPSGLACAGVPICP